MYALTPTEAIGPNTPRAVRPQGSTDTRELGNRVLRACRPAEKRLQRSAVRVGLWRVSRSVPRGARLKEVGHDDARAQCVCEHVGAELGLGLESVQHIYNQKKSRESGPVDAISECWKCDACAYPKISNTQMSAVALLSEPVM